MTSQKLDDSDRECTRKCACRRRAKGSTATKEDWFPLQFNLIDDFRKIRRYLQTAKKGLSRTYECQTPRIFEKEFPLLEACRKIFVSCDRQHNGALSVTDDLTYGKARKEISASDYTILVIYVYGKGRFSKLSMCETDKFYGDMCDPTIIFYFLQKSYIRRIYK